MPLQFIVQKVPPGIYSVDINGHKASFTVVSEKKESTGLPREIALTGFVVFAIATIVVATLLVRRLRTT